MKDYFIEIGGVRNGFFVRNTFIKKNENFASNLEKELRPFNNTDIYYCLYACSNIDLENCLFYAPLYLDLDRDLTDEQEFIKLKKDALIIYSILRHKFKIPDELIQLYFSGSKGFHIIVHPEVFGITPSRTLNIDLKNIAIYLKQNTIFKSVDTQIYDNRRLFRFPNSINSKTGLYKVPITFDFLRECTLEQMLEYAKEPKELIINEPYLIKTAQEEWERIVKLYNITKQRKLSNNKKKIVVKNGNILPCVKKLLQSSVAKGCRNNTAIALASSLFQIGKDREEVEEIMLDWNNGNNPPLPESEIRNVVKSAENQISNNKAYGCTFFMNNGYCLGKECKLSNR